jgi:hypothetical protein
MFPDTFAPKHLVARIAEDDADVRAIAFSIEHDLSSIKLLGTFFHISQKIWGQFGSPMTDKLQLPASASPGFPTFKLVPK